MAMAPLWVNSILLWLLEMAARESYGGVRWEPVRSAEEAMAVLMDAGAITFWLTVFLYILTELSAAVSCPDRMDRPERRRGAALGHYSCASMAILAVFTPVPFLLAGTVLLVRWGQPDPAWTAHAVLRVIPRMAPLIMLIPILAWWQSVLRRRPQRGQAGLLNSLLVLFALAILLLVIVVALSASSGH